MIQFESKGPLSGGHFTVVVAHGFPGHPGTAHRLPRCSVFDEAIPDAADGIKVSAGATQFLPQSPHVGIDRSSVDDVVVFPDIAKQLFP